MAFDRGIVGARVTARTQRGHSTTISGQVGVHVTDRRRLGVLLPDTGLREPDVSSSSADDQDERS